MSIRFQYLSTVDLFEEDACFLETCFLETCFLETHFLETCFLEMCFLETCFLETLLLSKHVFSMLFAPNYTKPKSGLVLGKLISFFAHRRQRILC